MALFNASSREIMLTGSVREFSSSSGVSGRSSPSVNRIHSRSRIDSYIKIGQSALTASATASEVRASIRIISSFFFKVDIRIENAFFGFVY